MKELGLKKKNKPNIQYDVPQHEIEYIESRFAQSDPIERQNNATELASLPLNETEWLTNFHLDSFIVLIRKKYPGVRGLVDPNMYEIKTYIDTHGMHDCIFIIHLPQSAHWITISNLRCLEGEWIIYDSMNVDTDQLRPIFRFIFPSVNVVFIRNASVTQQKKLV